MKSSRTPSIHSVRNFGRKDAATAPWPDRPAFFWKRGRYAMSTSGLDARRRRGYIPSSSNSRTRGRHEPLSYGFSSMTLANPQTWDRSLEISGTPQPIENSGIDMQRPHSTFAATKSARHRTGLWLFWRLEKHGRKKSCSATRRFFGSQRQRERTHSVMVCPL